MSRNSHHSNFKKKKKDPNLRPPTPEENRIYELERHGWRCPRCKSPMRERVNRRDQTLFFGCSEYPRCRGTRYTDGSTRDTWEDLGLHGPRDEITQDEDDELFDRHDPY